MEEREDSHATNLYIPYPRREKRDTAVPEPAVSYKLAFTCATGEVGNY